MNIWEILHIESTTDKKAIKRAYAARTKVIHPEEKPEEFRQLHAAYQAALKYAEFAAKRELDFENIVKDEAGENREDFINDNFEPPTADESSEQENAERSELLSFFVENQEKQQQRVDAFVRHWQNLRNINDNPEAHTWWEEYLASEDFQYIRWNTQVMRLIMQEIDKNIYYIVNEEKMLFWKAYGFQKNDGSKYQGEQQKLWRCLYPAVEYYEKMSLDREHDRRSRRELCIVLAVPLVFFLVLSLANFFKSYHKRENERLVIEQYMAVQYPGIVISVPERSREQDDSGTTYTFYSSAHPELMVTAKIEYQYLEDEPTCLVTEEDYGELLLEYYAAQYGLEYGRMVYDLSEGKQCGVLYYPDIGQVDTFCETVAKMFREQEELQAVPSVGICTGTVLFPEVLVQGGVSSFPFTAPQLYDLRDMEVSAMEKLIREAYMVYMFQYESWNITLQQYGEWGEAYEKLCGQWESYTGWWYNVQDADTGENICRIYMPTYEHTYTYNVDDYYVPISRREMTVGNAYYYLMNQGADVTVNEDGTGFIVENHGQIGIFGTQPEVVFSELRDWYGYGDVIGVK